MVDGAADDALMVRLLHGMLPLTVLLVMTTVRVLPVMVLGAGLWMGGRGGPWAWALAILGAEPAGRCWPVGTPVLALLLASGVKQTPRQSWRRVPLTTLRVRVVQVMV